nr:MAG TPA: hypothetical protein [Caudoviricetes sp.]
MEIPLLRKIPLLMKKLRRYKVKSVTSYHLQM